MSEPNITSRDVALSTDIIGEYSPSQKEEFAILAGQIMISQGYGFSDAERVLEVRTVVEDSISRGLAQTGRRWFRPNDPISPTFEYGLLQRIELLSALDAVNSQLGASRFLTREEQGEAGRLVATISPLSPDLSGVETMVQAYDARKKVVSGFLQRFFDDSASPFFAQANELREVAQNARSDQAQVNLHEKMLNNLLVNLAIYSKPGLHVEPKDLALLSEVWGSENRYVQSAGRIRTQLTNAAERLGFDREALSVYVDSLLAELSFAASVPIHLDSLYVMDMFIITEEDLAQEDKEMKMVVEGNREPIALPVSAEKIELARQYLKHLAAPALDEDTDQWSEEDEDQYIQSFDAGDVIVLLNEIYNSHIVEAFANEIITSISAEVYAQALFYAYEGEIVIGETGERLPGFAGRARNFVKRKISQEVNDEVLVNPAFLGENITILPYEYLENAIHLAPSTEDFRHAFAQMSDAFWMRMLLASGVKQKMSLPEEKPVDNLEFAEDPGMQDFFEYLPKERQEQIMQGLSRIVGL